ncbi:MAG: hypothetical protein ACFCBW_09775 [Candidatus Competibacterales bacterium]
MTGEEPSIWTYLLVGITALAVLFFFGPSAKRALERSKNAPKDWPAVLIPLALVVLFVMFLVAMVQ